MKTQKELKNMELDIKSFRQEYLKEVSKFHWKDLFLDVLTVIIILVILGNAVTVAVVVVKDLFIYKWGLWVFLIGLTNLVGWTIALRIKE